VSMPESQLNRTRDPAWVVQVMLPGPNGVRFDDHASLIAPMALPAGVVTMYDSVTASALPTGAPAYAGYYNGSFAILNAIKARFPSATIVSVTPDGEHGAEYIDVEPGDAVPADAPSFIKLGGLGFYCSASQTAACVAACTKAGIARTAYRIWSAHWIGRHICSPAACGYPAADGTQYASTSGWDESAVNSPAFFSLSTAPSNPWPLAVGSTGANVVIAQRGLNKWRYASPLLVTDGIFGTATTAAVKTAQAKLKMTVNGIIDQALWTALLVNPPTPLPPPVPTPPKPAGGTQDNWRWCDKCQGLFWGGNAAKSRCPAGGAHAAGSWNYKLPWTSP
jgi:hypothetical protein